jgi:hypothetical protein
MLEKPLLSAAYCSPALECSTQVAPSGEYKNFMEKIRIGINTGNENILYFKYKVKKQFTETRLTLF